MNQLQIRIVTKCNEKGVQRWSEPSREEKDDRLIQKGFEKALHRRSATAKARIW